MDVVRSDGEILVFELHVDGILIESGPRLRQAIILAFQDFGLVVYHRRSAQAALQFGLEQGNTGHPVRIRFYNNFDKNGISELENQRGQFFYFKREIKPILLGKRVSFYCEKWARNTRLRQNVEKDKQNLLLTELFDNILFFSGVLTS